ncbi:cytochrome oxidase assembly protein-domain-containing protein [Phlebopus sp. FC_14]|nr:cytochrome oxidase assembly protein-domain-containing protein [Phlebopus sp. FC_14]
MRINLLGAVLRPNLRHGPHVAHPSSIFCGLRRASTLPEWGLRSRLVPKLQPTSSPIRTTWLPGQCYSVVTHKKSAVVRGHGPLFFSGNAFHAKASALPVLAPPAVGRWLLFSSALVFAVIVVGGVTRLTESGLSITEWRPITGVIPPLNAEEWNKEFEKYKATPEFKLLNHSISLDEFKNIFYMEWGHRVLGRLIGVGFVVPLAYFAFRRRLAASMPAKLTGMALLIGFQGFLGWYMVKSGLEDSLMETPGAVPRVSQYRLAAHLGTALLLYAGMLGTGLAAIKDWRYARGGHWSGSQTMKWEEVLSAPTIKRFIGQSRALTALVLLTALSGAFVAGLDAGLQYNEFPLMGGRLIPPIDELFASAYAKNADGSDVWWRNIFENPTTVQFDHRLLAMTTYFSTCFLYWQSRRNPIRALLPPRARMSATAAFAMANVQVLLGLATLLYLVPVPVAAAHQAGSVALLSTMVHLLVALRRPSMAAQLWRRAGVQGKKVI